MEFNNLYKLFEPMLSSILKNLPKVIVCLICIILGIVIVSKGFSVMKVPTVSGYDMGEFASFGADFYTYMFGVTYRAGEAINKNTDAINQAYKSICEAIGWVIVSLGLIEISFFSYKLVNTFSESRTNKDVFDISQEAPTTEQTEATIYNTKNSNPVAMFTKEFETAETLTEKSEADGYMCPVCKLSMDSQTLCERCGYDPTIEQREAVERNTTNAEENSTMQLWQKLRFEQGDRFGRCNLCGKKSRPLAFLEFEDQFGKGQGNLCYDCFLKKQNQLK